MLQPEHPVNILLVSLNPFLEKMMTAFLLARDNKQIGKIYVLHCVDFCD